MNKLLKKLYTTLETIKTKFEKNQKQIEDPQNATNFDFVKNLSIENARIEEIYYLYIKTLKDEKELEDNKQLVLSKDIDFLNEAKKEVDRLTKQIDLNASKLQVLLLPKDEDDNKNVVVEIRGAAGGDEANIFAGDLFRMYSKYIESLKKYKIQLLNSQPSQNKGFSYIAFSIKGPKAYSLLKWESGSHRVQRVPATESKGRVHTSTATVLVMPEALEVDVKIDPSDLRIDTFRSSGAGGQHVNTTDSAIRITHIPTGIVSQSQDGRSQHKNKEIALTVLKTKLYDAEKQKKLKERGEEAKNKIGSGDRSEKIRTYNYPQNRVTDHRINFSLNSLDKVMEGDLEAIIKALLSEEQRKKIANSQL